MSNTTKRCDISLYLSQEDVGDTYSFGKLITELMTFINNSVINVVHVKDLTFEYKAGESAEVHFTFSFSHENAWKTFSALMNGFKSYIWLSYLKDDFDSNRLVVEDDTFIINENECNFYESISKYDTDIQIRIGPRMFLNKPFEHNRGYHPVITYDISFVGLNYFKVTNLFEREFKTLNYAYVGTDWRMSYSPIVFLLEPDVA